MADLSLYGGCDAEQWAKSNMDRNSKFAASIRCFTLVEAVGLSAGSMAGVASLLAILTLLGTKTVTIARLWMKKCAFPKIDAFTIYIYSLLFSESFQAAGKIMDLEWALQGFANVGPHCTRQGIFKELGETTAAGINLAITVHIICSVWRGRQFKRRYACLIIVCIWLAVAVFIAVTVTGRDIMTPTPYWCWIGRHERWVQIVGLYLWLWLNLALWILCTIVHVCTRSDSDKASTHRWRLPVSYKGTLDPHQLTRLKQAICYPLLSVVLILPLSAVRFHTFIPSKPGAEPNPAVTFTVSAIYACSGLCTVLVYTSLGTLFQRDFARVPGLAHNRQTLTLAPAAAA